MLHKGSQVIQTERLTLRPFRVSDAEEMFCGWANDGEVTRFLTWTPHGSIEETRAFLLASEEGYKRADYYHWALEYEGGAIGDICVSSVDTHSQSGMLGYCMAKKFWGQGFMTETLKAVLKFCFEEVGFHRIYSVHSAQNPASGRVMEKCGLKYEGTLRDGFKLHSTGEWTDIDVRAILKEDYLKSL
ncbi:MAG: GNAT family N-acetyltransferase [Clostridiales bacterium]|nr:GNAT family N-acetyltransferase [Clostridiales bacterium]